MNPFNLSEIWSFHLLEQLKKQNVQLFSCSPGSRNSPLLVQLSKMSTLQNIHYDERGSSFYSLGFSKATKQCSCVFVTSGSACGNLLPAIMECYASHIPMIIITTDRPDELHDCGSNQTVSQSGMFEKYVAWQCDISPSSKMPVEYIKGLASHAAFKAQTSMRPVHINLKFREPFFSTNQNLLSLESLDSTKLYHPKISIDDTSINSIVKKLKGHEKGLIILGYEAFYNETIDSLITLSEKLGYPIFADIASGARNLLKDHQIHHFDLLLKSEELKNSLAPTCVLHFGGQYTSKGLLQWLSQLKPNTVFHISSYPDRQDPFSFVTDKVQCPPSTFCIELVSKVDPNPNLAYFKSWNECSTLAKKLAEDFFNTNSQVSEPSIFKTLSSINSFKSIFIGNSMPIRDADMHYFPNSNSSIFASRGLSGIDGNIATAIGIARGIEGPMLAVIGDLTFLHDINSLSQATTLNYPLTIIVVNNSGGGIFSFLPIKNIAKSFDKHIATKHAFHFEDIAKQFNFGYNSLNEGDLFSSLNELLLNPSGLNIIEIKTNQENNLKLHQQLNSQFQSSHFCALC